MALQGSSFLLVVGGFAAHDQQNKDSCGEGYTFPTPLRNFAIKYTHAAAKRSTYMVTPMGQEWRSNSFQYNSTVQPDILQRSIS